MGRAARCSLQRAVGGRSLRRPGSGQERLCFPAARRWGRPGPGGSARGGIAVAACDPQREHGDQRPGAQRSHEADEEAEHQRPDPGCWASRVRGLRQALHDQL